MSGYQSQEYATALAELGSPRRLPACGGWVLERPIAGGPDRDAMGCYPLFCCAAWDRLADDLGRLTDELVSLTLVADPFGDYRAADLAGVFNRGAVPFKRHHVAELGGPLERTVAGHHRRNARKALRQVSVEVLESPAAWLDEWAALYAVLADRHDIRGPAAFSRQSFARQLAVPGLVAFAARHDGRPVGMLLWYVQGPVAYYHLGAYSPAGYELGASFALFWSALAYLAGRVAWANLGAGPGAAGGDGGLDRFKSGWATTTRTAYLCRHVFQPGRYATLAAAGGWADSDWFPAYRAGESAPAARSA